MDEGVISAVAADYPWSDGLRERYREKHYVLLEDFVSPRQIGQLLAARSQCVQKLFTGANPESTWTTYQVDKQHWLRRDLLESGLSDRLNVVTGDAIRTPKTNIWYMDYRLTEFIEPHSDANWTLLLIICLRSAAKENGGILHLCVDEQEEEEIELVEGQAVAFSGAIVHHTSRLLASSAVPNPVRSCLVITFL